MAKPNYSYSRFSTYESCKQKYKLQYIDELSVIGKEIAVQQKGLSIHQIAEQLTSSMTYEELLDIAKKDLEGRDFDQEKFPVIKAIPRLYYWFQEFVKKYENQGYKLYKESWEKGIIGGKPIVGALDTFLYNETTKEVRIYDFKTAKTANASSYKNQLLLYAWLIGKRLNMQIFSDNIRIFVFFPLSDIKDEETTDAELAKKQAMKMMKEISFTEEDITSNITNFARIIQEDQQIDWSTLDPVEAAQISYSCSWCDFAGNKTYCPLSYASGLRFPRKAKVLTKEELKALKEQNG